MRLPKDRRKLLKRAEKYIFSTGVEDAASHMCKVNMKYGLAKIHYVQNKYGFEPNATFISTPDETVTRNVSRWEQGFGYGGRITWGSGKDKLMILDVKPNACGMLVGGLNKLPKPKDVVKSVFRLEKKTHYVNDIKVDWDFYKGNHFIDIFEIENVDKKIKRKFPRYAAIMHAGCGELKGDTEKFGFGLYWNESKTLAEMAHKVKTPYGYTYTLLGSKAKQYYDFFKKAEDFALKRREIAFKEIFRSRNMIVNETHQGLVNLNEISLGCHIIKDPNKQLFPVSIKADVPSYIFKGKFNFTKEMIENLGFNERAREFGVYKRLRNANLLPHGGGYLLQDSLYVDKVFEIDNRRYFEIDLLDGIGKKIVSNIRELQFAYRTREVVLKTIEIGLGEPVCDLRPIYTIKF